MRITLPLDSDEVVLSLEEHEDGIDAPREDPEAAMKIEFLRTYEACGLKMASLREIGSSAQRLNRWRAEDPSFERSFLIAKQVAGERLHEAAKYFATVGARKYKFSRDGTPVWWLPPIGHPECVFWVPPEDHPQHQQYLEAGSPVQKYVHYYETTYSESLLTLLLKAEMPETFGDKLNVSGEITHKAYVCFDPTRIGSRSSSETLPAEGQRDRFAGIERQGSIILRPGQNGQESGMSGENSLPMRNGAGMPGTDGAADPP